MMMQWSETELDIAETLACRLQMMELGQIGQVWWPDVRTAAVVSERLKPLVIADLLRCEALKCHPLLNARQPLLCWFPDDDEPDLRRISSTIRGRWPWPLHEHVVYYATRRASSMFGCTPVDLRSTSHWDHDLLLADAYIGYRKHRPDLACDWVGENQLPRAGYRIKDPDAFLVDSNGETYRVIESAGRYNLKQLQSFHDHCSDFELPYELW